MMDAATLAMTYPDVDREVLARASERIGSVTRGQLYHDSRQSGSDDRFATICALRRCAAANTDDTYLGGLPHFADVMGEDYAKDVYAEWDRQGVSYTAHTNYNPFHASYRGDPAGIVEGRSSITKRLEMLNQEPLVDPRSTAPRLAEDLIQECAANFVAEHPDEAAKMKPAELRENMIEKHGRKK